MRRRSCSTCAVPSTWTRSRPPPPPSCAGTNLRAGFRQRKEGSPVQVVHRTVRLPWQDEDLTALPETEREAKARELADAERARPFDMTKPPLLRYMLIKLADDLHRMVFTNHHILLDGWSTPVLQTELFALYLAKGDDTGMPRVAPTRTIWRGSPPRTVPPPRTPGGAPRRRPRTHSRRPWCT